MLRLNDVELKFYVANSFVSRLVGIFSRKVTGYDGILIFPCSNVHTFFMRRPIDVAFLAKDMRILKVVKGMRPNRVSGFFGAFSVVEMYSDKSNIEMLVGDMFYE